MIWIPLLVDPYQGCKSKVPVAPSRTVPITASCCPTDRTTLSSPTMVTGSDDSAVKKTSHPGGIGCSPSPATTAISMLSAGSIVGGRSTINFVRLVVMRPPAITRWFTSVRDGVRPNARISATVTPSAAAIRSKMADDGAAASPDFRLYITDGENPAFLANVDALRPRADMKLKSACNACVLPDSFSDIFPPKEK